MNRLTATQLANLARKIPTPNRVPDPETKRVLKEIIAVLNEYLSDQHGEKVSEE